MSKAIKIIAIIAIIVLLAGLSYQRHTKYSIENATVQSYVVQAGDTLWDIANLYKPSDMRYDEYIYEVKLHNGISADIKMGQAINILIWEES